MTAKLTDLQAAFVREYLIDLNASQAIHRAGSRAKDLAVAGSNMLAIPKVAAAVEEAIAKRAAKTEIDANWVLRRLAAEAEADIADLYDEETGDLLPVHKWPLIWRQGLVAGVEVNALFEGYGEDRIQVGEVKKLKLSDRVKRLELIGKHVRVNAFQDVVQHKGLDGLAERLGRAKKRKQD